MSRSGEDIIVTGVLEDQSQLTPAAPVTVESTKVAPRQWQADKDVRDELVKPLHRKHTLHPSGLRRVTERLVAHLLMRSDALSRYDLSRQTGLSLTAIGKIINSLAAAGVVERVELTSDDGSIAPTLGRPSEYFRLATELTSYVAVEIGVRNTLVAGLPIAGPVGDIHTAQFRTPKSLARFTSRLTAALEALEIETPRAVLVSIPGIVDENSLTVHYSPNLHWTEGQQLFEAIREVIPAQLVVVQEIHALAFGQLLYSDPKESFLLVDTGDGVGGAVVIEGQIHLGQLALSAEIGHVQVPGNQEPCGCGGVGCLETLVGRRGLLRGARQNKHSGARSWTAFTQTVQSNPLPEWLSVNLDQMSRVIAGALTVIGLSKVVLMGDVPELGQQALQRLNDGINKHALWGRFGHIQVDVAPRKRLAGLAAAALDRVILAPTPSEKELRRHLPDI